MRQSIRRRRLAIAVLTAGLLASITSPASTAAHAAAGPPHFSHVWTIVLENSGLYTSFGLGQIAAPYLARTLPGQGAFLPNYYGTGHSSLDNYIAMTSGQAPSSATQDDCTDPSQLGAGDPHYHFDGAGQAIGKVGCTYQADVANIASQLRSAGRSWKSYNESMDAQPFAHRSHCQGPDTYGGGAYEHTPDSFADADAAHQPHPNAYRAKHNPFVYYHNITDNLADCEAHDVPLGAVRNDTAHSYDRFGALRADLASEATTPAYSFITPDQCSDGHDNCKSNLPIGLDEFAKLSQMDDFVKHVVPLIMSSPAYGDRAHPKGLIVISFDEGTDSFACCDEQPSPELRHEGGGRMNGNPFGRGGGIVGAVALSPAIAPGTVSTNFYNHYSYLRTMEDIFGLAHLGYAATSAYPRPSTVINPGGPPRSFGADVWRP